MSALDFSLAGVLAEARDKEGLEDLGSGWFEDGLAALLATIEGNAFNEKRSKRNRSRLVGGVGTRLRVQAALERHPEIAEREIRQPMVLTGLPRSGTSALFNLLGEDPAARPLLLWETQFPEPMEGLAEGQPDPRYEAIKAYYDQGREKNPEWSSIHFTSADTPEECVLLHAFTFHGVQWGIEIFLEPYASWYQANLDRLAEMYAYQKTLLQMLDWQRPGVRWLLKAPAHMWGIDALLATFPDASVVWSHRNPLSCVASACSMTQSLIAQVDGIDPKWLGPEVMEFYARSLERGLERRDEADPARFVDVSHDEFVADSLGVVRRIYDHFDVPIEDADTALRAHVDANPKGKHGSHAYGLEEFGLTEAQVRDRFAAYTDRFDIAID